MPYYHTWDGWGDHCLGTSKRKVLAWGKTYWEDPPIEELNEEGVIDLLDSQTQLPLKNLLTSLRHLEQGELIYFWSREGI